MKKITLIAATAITFTVTIAITALACSSFVFDTPQGNQIQGRTMELGFEAGERFMIAPRGCDLKGVKGISAMLVCVMLTPSGSLLV